MPTLAVVLAGGRGERMAAAAPKALLELEGSTLLERAVATARGACDQVVVAAPAEMRLPDAGAGRVADPPEAAGPLAGMVAGLRARRFDAAVVLAVDFPLATAATLRRLLERLVGARDGGRCAAVPSPGGVPQPLLAAYAPEAVAPLAAALAAGVRSPVAAVRELGVEWVTDDELARWPGGAGALLNVNTPQDLEKARAALRSSRPADGA
jgi:molybdopterin-guanine dinucleotide biosynthesis protein A